VFPAFLRVPGRRGCGASPRPRPEKVARPIPVLTLILANPASGTLVHKSGRLEVCPLLKSQPLGGQFAQFLVDQRS